MYKLSRVFWRMKDELRLESVEAERHVNLYFKNTMAYWKVPVTSLEKLEFPIADARQNWYIGIVFLFVMLPNSCPSASAGW
jgi:hypothetical protein